MEIIWIAGRSRFSRSGGSGHLEVIGSEAQGSLEASEVIGREGSGSPEITESIEVNERRRLLEVIWMS